MLEEQQRMKPKNLHLLFITFLFFACNNKKAENSEVVLQDSTSLPENAEHIKDPHPKTLFDLINNKKETAHNLPKDFDFTNNYSEKEIRALNLDPEKISANEYYFLSEQKFLKKDIEGLSFQIYYKHSYGNQLEKILRVQRTDTVFDIILSGKYNNGSDGSTLSTQFINDKTFRESLANIKTVKDEPHILAYTIDSLITIYNYDKQLNFIKNRNYELNFYKEIKENPETGKQDTLFEKIVSLGKIQNTEFLSGVSYAQYNKNFPETITIYSKNKNKKTRLETIETWGAYIDDMELFSMNNNHFIYIRMSETSGNSYSYFYAIDTKKMILSEVEQNYGNSKLSDSLQFFKGGGIIKDADNKFTSGSTLRSESGRVYYSESEYKMIKENSKFVLKCTGTKITPTYN